MNDDLRSFALGLPKAELHLHLEGTLEPELMLRMAERNGVSLPYASVEEVHAAYHFADLKSFLDLYYAGCAVLLTEQDFYDLTWAYLTHAIEENVRHAEVFFDPQTHTERGVHFGTAVAGILYALDDAEEKLGLSYRLIMSFMRDLPAASAAQTLKHARLYGRRIAGIGLDSAEVDHPPEDFAAVFASARDAGYHVVAHAGEEGPPAYVSSAIDNLGAERIDHGVQCMSDPELVARLVRERIPLTVCPLSNVRLRIFPTLADHPLKKMLDAGLLVTVNSDDPAYFGGYLTDNYVAAAEALGLTRQDLATLAANSFAASFLDPADKQRLTDAVRTYAAAHGG